MTVMAAEAGAGAAEAGAAESSAGAARAARSRSRRARPGPAVRARQAYARAPKSSGNYQPAILAEFVAAVLLVAATPFAKKDSPGLSPYAGKDMLQLVALTLTYFLLALVSGVSPRAARLAAWFGLLILLTVGLFEAARLAQLLNVFGLTSPEQDKTPGPAGPGPGGIVPTPSGQPEPNFTGSTGQA